MNELSDRLQILVDVYFNHNKAAFARACKIPPTTLTAYFNPKKRSLPNAEYLESIIRATGVNANWLLTGEGEMNPTEKTTIIQHHNGDGDNIHTNGQSEVNKPTESNTARNMTVPDMMGIIMEKDEYIAKLMGLINQKDAMIMQLLHGKKDE